MSVLGNAGLPMLFVYAPVLFFAFIPVVFIESVWIRCRVKHRFGVIGTHVLIANLVSTIVGVPVTWFVLVLLQLVTGGGGSYGIGWHAVTWQAPWLLPYEDHLHWMIPAAGLVLTVPFFVISAVVEYFILKRLMRDWNIQGLAGMVWGANGLTYGLIACFWGVLFRHAILG